MKTNNKFYRVSFTLYVVVLLVIAHLSCNPGVPGNGSSGLAFLNNIRKVIGVSTENATVSVSGTIKDGSGSGISGATLDIGSGTRAVVDTKVFTNSTGEFTMNLKVGNFSVRVTSSTGVSLGSFDLSVTGTSTPPTISNATGSISVSNLSANPVGLTQNTTPTAFIVFNNAGFSSLFEGSSRKIGVALTGTVTSDIILTIVSDSSSVKVGGTVSGGTLDTNGIVTVGGTVSGSGSTATLTFTPSNYTTFQEVLVSSVIDTNDINETVTLTISSSKTTDKTISFKTTDKDSLNFSSTTVIPSQILEGDTSGNVKIPISLTKAPDSNLIVTVTSGNTNSLKLNDSTFPQTVTFTPSNYATQQFISIQALTDANKTSDEVEINLSAPGLGSITQKVLIYDKDVQVVFSTINPNQTFILEGSTATFTVNLESIDPGVNRTITINSSTPSLTVSPSSLTFTAGASGNYATPQTVTLTAISDVNTIDETVTISSSGGNLVSATLASFSIYDAGNFILDVSLLDGTINLY